MNINQCIAVVFICLSVCLFSKILRYKKSFAVVRSDRTPEFNSGVSVGSRFLFNKVCFFLPLFLQ